VIFIPYIINDFTASSARKMKILSREVIFKHYMRWLSNWLFYTRRVFKENLFPYILRHCPTISRQMRHES